MAWDKKRVSPEQKAASREKSNENLKKSKGRGFTKEQQRAGQRAQAAKRHEQRVARDLMKEILSMATGTDTLEAGTLERVAVEVARESGGSLSVYQAALIAQAARAVAGDTAAAAFCRDTAGDKPTDKQEITGTITEGDKALCAAVAARLECNKSTDFGVDKTVKTDK